MQKFKNVGQTLTRLRKEKNYLQSDVANMLADRGINVTIHAVSKWENGITIPNAVVFLNLCDILGVEDVMSCFSNGRVGFLSGLNRDGMKMITNLIHALSESSRYSQADI